MTPEGGGYFVHRQAQVEEGLPYAFRLADGHEYPDPASRWQPQGVHSPSAVFFPGDYRWSDDGWRGIAREDLVIYELHVGVFTPEGTFEAIVPRLPELLSLGVTAIELMPVAQFAGDRNWGYDGVYPYAVQNSYGGPRALQRLVDAAHRAGLAVILDVVYNHFGSEGNYCGNFGPYFTDRYHTPGRRRSITTGRTAMRCGSSPSTTRGCGCGTTTSTACGWTRCTRSSISARGTSSPRSRRRCSRKPPAGSAPVHVIAESNQNDVRLGPAAGMRRLRPGRRLGR